MTTRNSIPAGFERQPPRGNVNIRLNESELAEIVRAGVKVATTTDPQLVGADGKLMESSVIRLLALRAAKAVNDNDDH